MKSSRVKVVRRENCGFSNRMCSSGTMRSAISFDQYLRQDFFMPTGNPCREMSKMCPPARLNQVAIPPSW